MGKIVKVNHTVDGFEIDIESRTGVFIFLPTSGSGKTLLYTKIVEYPSILEDMVAFSIKDKYRGVKLDTIVDYNRHKVLVIDRYDMMQGEYVDVIANFAKTGVVLLATNYPGIKTTQPLDIAIQYIPIVYKKNKLEVIQNDLYAKRRIQKIDG